MYWFMVVMAIVAGWIIMSVGLLLFAVSLVPPAASWRDAFRPTGVESDNADPRELARARRLKRTAAICILLGLGLTGSGYAARLLGG